jgi:glycosyltransferase involved in cell wall biosynthesis
MNKKDITFLYAIPPFHHVQICKDEMEGFKKFGINCFEFTYGNNSNDNKFIKLCLTLFKCMSLIYKSWKYKPSYLYLNSRITEVSFLRDFITIGLLKILYPFKFKIIYKSHGSDVSVFESSKFLNRISTKYLIRKIDCWLVLSKEEIENLSYYITKSKIVTVKNIVNISNLSSSTSSVLKKHSISNFKILFAGRLIKEKGIFEIIEAIEKFNFKDECTFIFAGDGPEKKSLNELIKEKNIHNTLFLGNISEVQLDQLYKEVDLLLFPSHEEGFSMVLFNSVASALPIITTQIRAAKDYLKEPDNTLWVEINNPSMIAEKLNELFGNRELRISMSKNNYELGQSFDQQTVCEEILKKIKLINCND